MIDFLSHVNRPGVALAHKITACCTNVLLILGLINLFLTLRSQLTCHLLRIPLR